MVSSEIGEGIIMDSCAFFICNWFVGFDVYEFLGFMVCLASLFFLLIQLLLILCDNVKFMKNTN